MPPGSVGFGGGGPGSGRPLTREGGSGGGFHERRRSPPPPPAPGRQTTPPRAAPGEGRGEGIVLALSLAAAAEAAAAAENAGVGNADGLLSPNSAAAIARSGSSSSLYRDGSTPHGGLSKLLPPPEGSVPPPVPLFR